MKFYKPNSLIYVPDAAPIDAALGRTTHMALAAHQDDIEIMAFHGVKETFQQRDKFFCAVVATDGAGSARDGRYEKYTDADMQKIRRTEQKNAADVGDYGALVLLDYASKEMKNPADRNYEADLETLFSLARPEIVYTHNLADKHDTHCAVVVKTIKALRALPVEKRPRRLYGCEVWRGLDWLNDEDKTVLDVTGYDSLANALLCVFDSQIAGGKRYDLATDGRRRANATYYASHAVDSFDKLSFALDLTPLLSGGDIGDYIASYIDRFKNDVASRLRKLL
jgi:LmbE family N-acetylglucosaminyl deacetylase